MSRGLELQPGLFRRLIVYWWALMVVVTSLLPSATFSTRAQQSLKSPAVNRDTEVLELHKNVEGTIPPNGSSAYSIVLEANKYLRVRIICAQADVSAIDPAGNTIVEGACDNRHSTPFSFVARKGGQYVLIVRATEQSRVAQQFSLEAVEVRTTTAQDLQRIKAERLVSDAIRLRREWRTESSESALRLFVRALGIWISLRDTEGQGLTLLNLGRTYESLDQTGNAIDCYERALTVSDKRRQAEALARLTSLYAIIPESDKAIKYGNLFLELSQQVQDKHLEAETLINIGDAHYIQNDLKLAIENYEKCRGLLDRINDLAIKAQLEISLGYAFLSSSKPENAIKSFHDAVAFSTQVNNRYLLALALRGLGSLYTRLGQPQRGLEASRQALGLVKQGEGRLLKARVLAGIGYTYERLGDSDKALAYDNEAIRVFQDIGHKWGEAELLMDRGRVYYFLGEKLQALHSYESAQRLFGILKLPRYQAQTLSNIGLVYSALGNKAKALESFRDSLIATREKDKRSYAYTLNYRGELKAADHRPGEARTDFEEALPLLKAAKDEVGQAITLYNLARSTRDLGHLEEAAQYSEAALRIIESIRASVAGESLRMSFGASMHQHYELRVDILMRLHKEQPARGFDVAALEASEKGRARSLLESFAKAETDIRAGVDQALLNRRDRLKRQLEEKGQEGIRLHARAHTQKEEDALVEEQTRLTREWEEIQEQIRANNQRYTSLPEITVLSGEQIQKSLDNDSLLLEFSLGEDRSYAWLVSSDSIKSFTLPVRKDIKAACEKLYAALTEPLRESNPLSNATGVRVSDREAKVDQLSQELSKLILGNFQNLLGRKRLLIVADGALQYIPFEVLRSGATSAQTSAPLLIDNHEIVYLPSVSVLARQQARLANRPIPSQMLAILADPVFDNMDSRVRESRSNLTSSQLAQRRSHGNRDAPVGLMSPRSESTSEGVLRAVGFNQGIPRLPYSYQEAQRIKSLVPGLAPFVALNFDANRRQVTSGNLTNYRWLHFATHGILNSQVPELSGLLFSMVDHNGKAQDGFLQLHEIYDLNLSAELIVLSACQTALGKEIRGEGLFGLTRGFMHAGAKQVVSSLWKVDDSATADLMELFYKEMLVNGRSPAAALQQAKINLRKQKRWQNSFYWAGFIIQGDWR